MKALPQALHTYGFTPVCMLRCMFKYLPSEDLSNWRERKFYHMYHTCMVSLQYVFKHVGLNERLERMFYHIYHTCMASLQCVF